MQYLVYTIGGRRLDSFSNENDALMFAKTLAAREVGAHLQVCAVVANVKGEATVSVETSS